ncbi:AMP-binding protein [Nocardia africana]|uniref:AMP-binding protein n=1 Tax=Nocardia africana TaxID=134964 RepID=UPI00215DB20B|nr:AMP-binding protein [Nocardia africana]
MPTELQNISDDQALVRGWLVDPATATGIHLADEEDGWQFRSYAELAELTWSVAGRLRERGLGGGDEAGVCVVMPTGFPCVAAFYAVWACGGVFTPIAPPMFADMAQYISHVAAILEQAVPRVVVTSVELETLVRQAMTAAGRADEPVVVGDTATPAERTLAPAAETALLQFTSGSTGTPRGVRVSWHNLATNIRMISRLIDWRPGEAMVSWLPLYHDMGLVGAFLTTVANQGDLYLMRPDQFVRDPARWLRAMTHAQHSPSPSFALGYVAHRVSPDDIAELDLSGWRTLAVGSEPVEVEDLRSFAELTGARGFSARAYTLAYGLAEATLMVTSSARDRPLTALRVDTATLRHGAPVRVVAEVALADDRWVSGPGWITGLGFSTPESTVVVVDEDGRELPDGVLGEMAVIGDSVALGYTDGAGGATRITDGRLYTGDAGFRYHDEVFVLGRMGTSLKVRAVRCSWRTSNRGWPAKPVSPRANSRRSRCPAAPRPASCSSPRPRRASGSPEPGPWCAANWVPRAPWASSPDRAASSVAPRAANRAAATCGSCIPRAVWRAPPNIPPPTRRRRVRPPSRRCRSIVPSGCWPPRWRRSRSRRIPPPCSRGRWRRDSVTRGPISTSSSWRPAPRRCPRYRPWCSPTAAASRSAPGPRRNCGHSSSG